MAAAAAPALAATHALAAPPSPSAISAESLRPVCLRLLLLPTTARCPEGWSGARFIRHSGAWAVLAWSSAIPPTLFLLPPADLEVPSAEAEEMAIALGTDAASATVSALAASASTGPVPAQALFFTCASAVAAAWLPTLLANLPQSARGTSP